MKTIVCGSNGTIGSVLMGVIEGAFSIDLPEYDLRVWDGAAKRAVMEMAEHYPGRVKIVTVGWYNGQPAYMAPDAPEWIKPLHWDTAKLVREYLGA